VPLAVPAHQRGRFDDGPLGHPGGRAAVDHVQNEDLGGVVGMCQQQTVTP